MNDRRKFLKSAGSTALFTSLGTSFFIACNEAEENIDPDNNNNNTSCWSESIYVNLGNC